MSQQCVDLSIQIWHSALTHNHSPSVCNLGGNMMLELVAAYGWQQSSSDEIFVSIAGIDGPVRQHQGISSVSAV